LDTEQFVAKWRQVEAKAVEKKSQAIAGTQ
jgi:hypothetical protein